MPHPYEALFNQFNNLGDRFKLLRGIVQNPVPVTQAELDEFRATFEQWLLDAEQLLEATGNALLKENPTLV